MWLWNNQTGSICAVIFGEYPSGIECSWALSFLMLFEWPRGQWLFYKIPKYITCNHNLSFIQRQRDVTRNILKKRHYFFWFKKLLKSHQSLGISLTNESNYQYYCNAHITSIIWNPWIQCNLIVAGAFCGISVKRQSRTKLELFQKSQQLHHATCKVWFLLKFPLSASSIT